MVILQLMRIPAMSPGIGEIMPPDVLTLCGLVQRHPVGVSERGTSRVPDGNKTVGGTPSSDPVAPIPFKGPAIREALARYGLPTARPRARISDEEVSTRK